MRTIEKVDAGTRRKPDVLHNSPAASTRIARNGRRRFLWMLACRSTARSIPFFEHPETLCASNGSPNAFSGARSLPDNPGGVEHKDRRVYRKET
ncbi:MAG: hypothetical protein GXP40_05900 [Chloroflexi bacterium]|nr:hypothetical protein [Chloroflexota bacterium]